MFDFPITSNLAFKRNDQLTFGDDTFQVNNVWMVKLSHDAGLTEEISSLLVCITSFQSLDGHTDLPLARHFETPTAHFTKFTFRRAKDLKLRQNTFKKTKRKKKVTAHTR